VSASAATWVGAGVLVWTAAMAVAGALCRAAAAGDAAMLKAHRAASDALRVPTPHEAVAAALVLLDVDGASLYRAGPADELEWLAGDGFASASPGAQQHAAARALRAGATVESAQQPPAVFEHRSVLVAATPVVGPGQARGALVVSSLRARPSLTYAERRVLRELADGLAALPELELARPVVATNPEEGLR